MAPKLVLAAAVFATLTFGQTATKISRSADGHPDLSGVWWGGADVGGRRPAGAPGPAPGGRGGPAPVTFSSLYQPSAQAKAKTME